MAAPKDKMGLLAYTLSQHSGPSPQRGNRATGIHSLSGVDPPPREEIGLLEYTLSVEWTLLPERK